MKKDRIVLATRRKKIADKMNDGNNIGKKMKANGNPDVIAIGTQLLDTSNALKAKFLERNKQQAVAKSLTGELNKLEDKWNADYKKAAGKAQEIYPDSASTWLGFGFNLADVIPTERPLPPKVTGLQVKPGNAAGKGDLDWNTLPKQTIIGYFIEVNSTDPIDHEVWVVAKPKFSSASKVTISGLKTGQKYWVRVTAYVTQGEGPPSSPVAFIAP